MATVQDCIAAALSEIGAIAAGETPTAEDSAYAFAQLNRMVDSWGAERLQIYAIARTVWTITPGTAAYIVGLGAVINREAPLYLGNLRFQDTSKSPTLEMPLDPWTDDEYASQPLKTLQSAYPTNYYYVPSLTTRVVTLWPVPTASSLQGVMYAPQAVLAFAALTNVLVLPPGYEEGLITNLAIRLMAGFEKQPDPSLVQRATDSKAIMKRSNFRASDLAFPAESLIGGSFWPRYNLLTDR